MKPPAPKKNKKSVLLLFVTEGASYVARLGFFLSILGLFFSVLLYSHLKTDVEELLPNTARSVQDMLQVNSRLHSMENIVVLVFSDDPKASKRFVEDFAAKLEKLPTSTVSRVEYRIDKEIQFFKDRRALFMDVPDLIKVRDYVRQRLDYETKKIKHDRNPKYRNRPFVLPEPKLDYEPLLNKYQTKVENFDRFPDGYYATKDEKIRALVVYMPGRGLDLAQKMKAAVERTALELNPKSYAPDLVIKYTGNVQNLLEESAALVADLVSSTIIVTILVILAMLIFYRSFWATLLLVASLFMGTFWTFGVAYLVVGYLNANTAFLASIVIGNGINFGIIFLARYLEERRRGKNNTDAIDISFNNTMTATGTAALAAGLSYGSLMLTGFRGFSQFGVIGLTGMILCWISAYTLLPAFLTLLDRRLGSRWVLKKPPPAYVARFLAATVSRYSWLVVLISLVAVTLSVSTFRNYKNELIETDLSKLRDKRSMLYGSGALYHYIDDIFGHSVSPMVILPKTREAAEEIAARFRDQQKREGKDTLITTVQTLDDFLPHDQWKKAAIIIQIRDMLTPDVLEHASPEDRKLAEVFTNPAASQPFRDVDLPAMVMVRFKEATGTVGNIVFVDKKIERGGDSSSALTHFVKMGRDITDKVEYGAPVAGGLPVSYDMYKSIMDDGPKATLFAFLAVVFLVIVLFRNLRIIGLTLFALLLGVTWLSGLIMGFHLKINFLNFIALPITFGIGIDYGVNIFQRYREDGAENILKVIQNTGGAVILCSLTTIIGYSSLLIAGNQAFVSFGRLAVFGELTCVTAAVVSLPAFLIFFSKRKTKKI